MCRVTECIEREERETQVVKLEWQTAHLLRTIATAKAQRQSARLNSLRRQLISVRLQIAMI